MSVVDRESFQHGVTLLVFDGFEHDVGSGIESGQQGEDANESIFHGTPSTTAKGTTQIVLSGTTGVVFTGYYIQDGQRIALSNAVPWSFEGERISSFEFRKLNPGDTLVVDRRYDGKGAHAKMTKPLGPGMPGMRVRVQNGLISETLVRGE